MAYYVYENWTHDRARVHRAECSHCNEGRGTQGATSDRNGRWHPPTSERDSAFKLAASLGRTDTKACGHCNP
jgi:hypothetical protein